MAVEIFGQSTLKWQIVLLFTFSCIVLQRENGKKVTPFSERISKDSSVSFLLKRHFYFSGCL